MHPEFSVQSYVNSLLCSERDVTKPALHGTWDTLSFLKRVAQCSYYKLLVLANEVLVCKKNLVNQKLQHGMWCEFCLWFVVLRGVFLHISYLISIIAPVLDRATNIPSWARCIKYFLCDVGFLGPSQPHLCLFDRIWLLLFIQNMPKRWKSQWTTKHAGTQLTVKSCEVTLPQRVISMIWMASKMAEAD